MRSKKLCAVCLLAIIFSGSLFCNAQLIGNDITICSGYFRGLFQGNKSIIENDFIYPSLYANFKNLDGISLKVLYNYDKYFSFGISLSHLRAINWKLPDSMLYQESKVNLRSLSPVVQIHTKLNETGAFNKIRLFLEVAPTIGISKLSLSNPLFEIREGNASISQPTGSNDMYFGLRGSLGAEVSLTQAVGLFLDCSYGYYRVSSKLYSDTHFANYGLEAGVVIKLKKNKRYFY